MKEEKIKLWNNFSPVTKIKRIQEIIFDVRRKEAIEYYKLICYYKRKEYCLEKSNLFKNLNDLNELVLLANEILSMIFNDEMGKRLNLESEIIELNSNLFKEGNKDETFIFDISEITNVKIIMHSIETDKENIIKEIDDFIQKSFLSDLYRADEYYNPHDDYDADANDGYSSYEPKIIDEKTKDDLLINDKYNSNRYSTNYNSNNNLNTL